ncbi:hypothetical protein [Streptomyces acidiscabies]|uniref:Uncharacterized protein n=3 Tax=Streptomyces acidiscabies TaxID=42234 RepID=A0AAP6BBQ7_9ACTN|nr:hypothetical protein [Streptomyces acidiscabies]MBZ3909164.1 hypothetical protein [Streptomyces acidiscabies]MDX2961703.1 hypothetical protein [Streptomyces acidiscabies]MDX3016428.1 hypothetical protein [Streptomyces acidiscabies]MDX3788666.1 hypothetical protein [Streptomyces acidiscabies]GAQ59458.1 hypothetical protein a10_09362 [Streptomyces acidiscabies]
MPGTVLLLAASPVGKGRLVDAASVLPVLAAVPPAVLAGTDTANVVELADPLEPQAVLTRLRAAAGSPGPLTLFVAGQLQLDRRQRLPHLALARTTPATVRYTGFPWHWFREELRLRAPGTTTVLLDLHADADTWEWLRDNPLGCGPDVAVHGRIVPPGGRRGTGTPAYMKAVGTILRSGGRPGIEQLHGAALARVRGDGESADLVIGPGTGWGAGAAGTYGASTTGMTGTGTTGPRAHGEPHPAAPVVVPPPPKGAPRIPSQSPAHPLTPATSQGVPGDAVGSWGVPGGAAGPQGVPGDAVGFREVPRDVAGPHEVPGDAASPHDVPGGTPADDPHAAITAAVQSGRHGDADVLAARQEETAVEAYGPGSDEALHWAEVRADLAMLAGDAERSCRTWLSVASLRLAAGQPVDAPAVEAAVDRAHHQWGRIDALTPARELAPALTALRTRVPGRREGALDHIRQQLRYLENEARATPAGR